MSEMAKVEVDWTDSRAVVKKVYPTAVIVKVKTLFGVRHKHRGDLLSLAGTEAQAWKYARAEEAAVVAWEKENNPALAGLDAEQWEREELESSQPTEAVLPPLDVTEEDVIRYGVAKVRAACTSWTEEEARETFEGHKANNTEIWREVVANARISKQEEQLRAQIKRADAAEKAIENEQTRWQGEIYKMCLNAVGRDEHTAIDGGGCDSGDPLDFTKTEISQAFAVLIEKYETLEARVRELEAAKDVGFEEWFNTTWISYGLHESENKAIARAAWIAASRPAAAVREEVLREAAAEMCGFCKHRIDTPVEYRDGVIWVHPEKFLREDGTEMDSSPTCCAQCIHDLISQGKTEGGAE